jgi:hypothetical protein
MLNLSYPNRSSAVLARLRERIAMGGWRIAFCADDALIKDQHRIQGCNNQLTSVSDRPKPGTGSHDIIALNRLFAACGKLRPRFMEDSRIARSEQMQLDIFVGPTNASSPD